MSRCRRLHMKGVKRKQEWTTTHLDIAEKMIPVEARGPKFKRWTNQVNSRKVTLVPGLKIKTFDFQIEGIGELVSRDAVLLADQMGLGKTIQVAQALRHLDSIRKPLSALVVCPASAKSTWRKELQVWGDYRDDQIYIISGKKDDIPKGKSIYVINYDIVEAHRFWIHAMPWDVVILDEGHYLKNKKTKRTLALFGGRATTPQGYEVWPALEAKRKYVLTGTPILNRPIEIYLLLHWLDPIGWSRAWDFTTKFCDVKITPFGRDTTGASNLDLLQLRLKRTVLVRRLKKDVLPDLPAKWRQIISVDPDKATAKVLKAERTLLHRITKSSQPLSDQEFADLMCGLKKHKIAFEEMSALRASLAEAKSDLVIEHLKKAVNSVGKVVVFVHHTVLADAIAKAFEGECAVLTGKTPSNKRQKVVDQFQEDKDCRLFIGNIQAAGTAITLTASSHVVFAELSWVPGEMAQAEDRLHRIGQEDNVTIQYLVVDGSIDARMAELLIQKQQVIEGALDG